MVAFDVALLLLLNGLLLGTFYALMASGLALIYGVMKIINVAHAAMLMLGAYFALLLLKTMRVDPALSSIAGIPVFFFAGMIIFRYLVSPISRSPPITSLLLLFGVWLILQNMIYVTFTGDTQSIMRSSSLAFVIDVGVPLPATRLMASVASVCVILCLYIFLSKTRMGKAIRATAQDREVSALLGVNVKRVSAAAFGLGTLLAGMAGGLSSLLYPFDPSFGGVFLIKSFLIIVLGGMESIIGMALGGVIVGLAESFAGFYFRFGLVDALSFVLFIVVLIVKPTGLFGKIRI